uniref:At1g61320/AtMIF1 LRR domain-containing protein n=1 Tax=Leersia perrieri TaxID=77586 RepID=A0A0D9Y1P0_9ORYZ
MSSTKSPLAVVSNSSEFSPRPPAAGVHLRPSILGCYLDIWSHIHSLMPMHDAARAACLSRSFLCSWRCRPNLTLEWKMNIDSILRNHSGIGLKDLKFDFGDVTFPDVDRWLQVAVTPGIEVLILTQCSEYNFPCSVLSDGVRNSIRDLQLDTCVFRPTSELGPLRRLTNLELSTVSITGDELECLLSNSLALEQMKLFDCNEIIFLKVPCVLKQLNRLNVISCYMLQEIDCKAPNLSIVDILGENIKLSLGQPLQMKELSLDHSNVICYACAELPSIMPNLERLTICSDTEAVNAPMLLTKFLYLKHLTIEISRSTDSPSFDCLSLVSFFDASPSLETLFLNLRQMIMEHESVFGGSSHLRQLPEHQHNCLKIVEMASFSSAKSLVELACYIVKNAVSLECLKLDTFCDWKRCCGEANQRCAAISNDVLKEAYRAVKAIILYIEDKVSPTTKLTVVEPCTRCHSSE